MVVRRVTSRETERERVIRIQVELQILRGHTPNEAVRTAAYRSGATQDQVREIVNRKLEGAGR